MGSQTGMEVIIESPTPTPRKRALLTSVADELVLPERWAGGVKFTSLDCTLRAVGEPNEWCDPESLDENESESDTVFFNPFTIWAAETCSTVTTEDEWLRGRNSIRMALWESWLLANELMVGTNGTNLGLTHVATEVPGGPWSPLDAIVALEGTTGYFFGNTELTFHMNPGVLTLLTAEGVVDNDSITGPYFTPSGHRISVDTGYGNWQPNPWTGPWVESPDAKPADVAADSGTAWIYASGPVGYKLGSINSRGGGSDAIAFDRNQRTNWLNREGIVVFDPCSVYAIEVDLGLTDSA